MGLTNVNKTLSAASIDCGGTLAVTLSLSASPDISANPADIVLLLDRSGSMAGTPLASMKLGAKAFIDILDESTDLVKDGQIGGGSRIAIVSFAVTATADTALITSVAELDAAIDAIVANGNTNTGDGFTTAASLFDLSSGNQRIIVLFTDGQSNTGPAPGPIAEQIKADGTVIYCIGLTGSGGLDEATLREWASAPKEEHVLITPDAGELEELFKELAASISTPGATDITVEEKVTADFTVESVEDPVKGSVVLTGPDSLRWSLSSLGANGSETASLTFTVKHTGENGGELAVNDSVVYRDSEGQTPVFPSPTVNVSCSIPYMPEACPVPVEAVMEGCQDMLFFDAGEVYIPSLGRILSVDVTVKNVCPHKKVALAVILTEVDENGEEQSRGMKIMTLPAHDGDVCRDILVKCVKFVLPENVEDPTEEVFLCAKRTFKVRLLANYLDSDYACCDNTD